MTSDGTATGTAVVWVLNAGHLQAYNPIPVSGKLTLIRNWFVGNTDAFTPPGIGNNMVYVANEAGMLDGFGMKVAPGGSRG